MSEAYQACHEFNLNEEQDLFCRLYAYGTNRGNGIQCYAEAYEIDLNTKEGYANARASSSRLLSKADILSYIRSMYEARDLNDEIVDNELAFVISQNADFGSKVAAIKEYNQLKQRIVKKIEQKNEHTFGGMDEDRFNELKHIALLNATTPDKGERVDKDKSSQSEAT